MSAVVYEKGTYFEVVSAAAGGRVLARVPYDATTKEAALDEAFRIGSEADRKRRNALARERRARKRVR
jgi:hypothetical protein